MKAPLPLSHFRRVVLGELRMNCFVGGEGPQLRFGTLAISPWTLGQVVSTYGFLLWLNRAPEPSDAECCMCTCGACFDVPGPPIFGINEEGG